MRQKGIPKEVIDTTLAEQGRDEDERDGRVDEFIEIGAQGFRAGRVVRAIEQ